jgi:hypothetical protein
MSKTYTTQKGSVLPLMQLKGKDYMIVAHRLVWLVDDEESYSTEVDFPVLRDDFAMAKVTLTIYRKDGSVLKRVQDCKTEHKKDFPDFVEKAITGALGRCLAQVGKGTNYAIQDLDEGHRIVDSPLETPAKTEAPKQAPAPQEPPKKLASFRKPSKPVESAPASAASEDDWS